MARQDCRTALAVLGTADPAVAGLLFNAVLLDARVCTGIHRSAEEYRTRGGRQLKQIEQAQVGAVQSVRVRDVIWT